MYFIQNTLGKNQWNNQYFIAIVRGRNPKDVHEGRPVGTSVIHHPSTQGLWNSETIGKWSIDISLIHYTGIIINVCGTD